MRAAVVAAAAALVLAAVLVAYVTAPPTGTGPGHLPCGLSREC